jgi:hypothetical protein
MSRLTRKLTSVAALASTLYALGACNAVLGMEEAELDEQTAALTCERVSRDPTVDCAKGSCEDCLSTCQDVGASLEECLEKPSCRKALMNYRTCAGDMCAPKTECEGCIEATGEPTAIRLGNCYEQCGGSCGPADIASMCDLYCACMRTRCPANAGNCLADCAARHQRGGVEDWRTYCWWSHCEAAATPNDGFHCEHAIDLVLCGTAPTANSQDVPCEFPKSFKNGACNENADCCSGQCQRDNGACK